MRYVIRKLLTMLITLLVVSLCVFWAFSVIPGDPATQMLGTNATAEQVNNLREQLGLNRPFIIRYAEWVSGLFTGDFGTSYSYNVPVKSMLAEKLPITLVLTGMSFVFILLISIPMGVLSAKYYDRPIIKVLQQLNRLFMAIPPFFIGIILTLVLGLILRLFTPGGFVSYSVNMGKFLSYMIVPSLAIAIPKSAMTVQMLKESVLSEAKLDYVRTAYSRGNSTNQVLYKHVLRNAFIPVVTFLGMTLADIVAGSIVIEQVFSIPGFGRLLITSISGRDYPVAQSIILIIAFTVMVVNFIVDILYKVIDPRVEKS